jgi:outer membrane immunogenic protein
MRLKLAGFVAAVSLAAAQSGYAADMPAKAPVYKAPAAAGIPWTGFYVNGGIGYGMWAADTTVVDTTTGVCIRCVTMVQGGKGWLATIGAGYDYQFTPRIVAGVFGDASLSSLKGTIQDSGPFYAADIKQTSSWAAGGRAGWLVTPMVMSYVNGGYTRARFSGADIVDTHVGAPTAFSSAAFNANGWFLGGGVEANVAAGWFWRTEYRYAYYGSKTLVETSALGPNNSITFKPTVQTVTSQVVYKFNGGLPAPVYPATPAMATNWTGFYANAGIGYGLWAADTTTQFPATGICHLCVTQVQGGKGYLGVIGVGYDHQFAPAWVVGVFGDFDISSLKGTIQDQEPQWAGDIKQTSAWAAGVRFGWLATPSILTYANGGYTGARFSGTDLLVTATGAPTGFTTAAFTRSGWFIGGGTETTFDALGMLGKGWFWRNEYRYASYNTQSIGETDAAGNVNWNITFKPVVQTVTSSVIFKFN